ncbi:MAG: TIGR00725 family protein [Dehalogenimonas sp.]|uniref:TIGR00725 family protein n=1 Tax=Candidatus Dehalogenimonas loeffleri TaxID=3127115 RepID=A0ABZ2J3Q3_9CHLR|nr:TIGR00725 family protein [Dehalogenimonas sp.]
MAQYFIAVIGASRAGADELTAAEAVGREIARNGAILVCGGLDGIMEAACKGASDSGGLTIGILPGEHRETANPYVKIPVVTGMGYARNAIVAKSGQAVIAIGGGYGTLSEIAYARQAGIPVIGLNTWQLSRHDIQDGSIVIASSAEAAVSLAISRIMENSE